MGPLDTVAWALTRAGCEPPAFGLMLFLDGVAKVAALEESLWKLCDRSTRLRQRVADVPLDLAPPEWVEDERFEIGRHFQRASSRARSIPALLRAARMDLDRRLAVDPPLWRAVLYDRLPHERSATLLQFHPSTTDGLGPSRLLAKIYGTELPVDPSAGGFSLTPRLTSADALLWRALQFNWDDLPDLVTSAMPTLLPESLVDPRSWMTRAPDTRWLTQLGAGLLGRSTAPTTARARRRSRRLFTCELEADAIDQAGERLGCDDHTILAHVLACALARARREAKLTDLPTEVWLPVQLAARRGPVLVDASIDGTQSIDQRSLRRFERSLRPRALARRWARYRLLARTVLALPAPVLRAAWTPWSRQRDIVHLTIHGEKRVDRFAGCKVRAIVPWVAPADRTPIAIAAHRYRDRYSLGCDIDPYAAPPPSEIQAAVLETGAERGRGRPPRRWG